MTMTTLDVDVRQPRGAEPEIVLQPPPTLPRGGQSGGGMQLLFMVPMMLAMGGMSVFYIGRSGGATTLIFGGLFVLVMGGMVVLALSRGNATKKAQINEERRDYLRYLDGLRSQVRDTAREQDADLRERLPDPVGLWTLVGGPRMWERGRGHREFGQIRVACGQQRLRRSLRPPQTAPLENLDPVCSTSLRQFIRTYATVDAQPIVVSLRSFQRVRIGGDRDRAVALVRAVLAQLALLHAPDDLRIAVCVGEDRRSEWEWTKWLPHLTDPDRHDAAGPARMCAASLDELPAGALESAEAAGAHLVVVADGGSVPARPGRTVLEPAAPPSTIAAIGDTGDGTRGADGARGADGGDGDAGRPRGELRLIATGEPEPRLGRVEPDGVRLLGAIDGMDPASAEVLARGLAAYAVGPTRRGPARRTGSAGLPELLGIADPAGFDPASAWSRRGGADRLRVPIGEDPDGQVIELDLKESAEGGMGPHGVVVGATGSGKSELLRTLVTGLAATHSSEALNLALIDFKGGATFAGMRRLPHTCAVITNLADELTLVDRMGDALRGELNRRQELLRAAGNLASVREYESARRTRIARNGADGAPPPIPSLLVIIDEFSELLSTRPEFTDLFVMIGRLGRSLAVHLLLASQRLDEGRLRGLDSHLSYRIGLRTFSASESRAVLGVADAHQLPSEPGHGFLKVDTTELIRFRSAYVSGPSTSTDGATSYGHTGGVAGTGQWLLRPRPLPAPYTLAPVRRPVESVAVPTPPSPSTSTVAATPEAATVMSVLIDRMVGAGPPAHQIWLPPLSEPARLTELLPPLRTDPERGLGPADPTGRDADGLAGRLIVPVGVVDKPYEQRRDLLWADLGGAAGHAVVVGAPQSGKTTVLQTLCTALALTHTPREVQLVVIDPAGGLSALARLPHCSGYATRRDPDHCRRAVAELECLLAERERWFAEAGIASMAEFRRSRPQAADRREFGDVFLIVDGWMTVRLDQPELEEPINRLAAGGLGFGIHVVLAANRWLELRSAVLDMIGTRFELRLGDPTDSAVDRRTAETVPVGSPGRGITAGKLHYLTALPIAGDAEPLEAAPPEGSSPADSSPVTASPETASPETAESTLPGLVERIASAWPHDPAPPVRLLPEKVDRTTLPAPDGLRLPIGIAERDLRTVMVDFQSDPHLLILGDLESGKTGLLRLLLDGIVAGNPPKRAAILLVDYRRTLLGTVPDEHLLGYGGSATALDSLIGDVVRGVRDRLPGPDVTADALRTRSWWSGPELFVVVDDYDLVDGGGGGTNPLQDLTPLLPQARDVGLHLVVARRTGGASRALYDPVLRRLTELGTPGVQLSGSPDEGPLLGGVKPSSAFPPGRGHYIDRRGGPRIVQVAHIEADQHIAANGQF